jgi:hypothetical protein
MKIRSTLEIQKLPNIIMKSGAGDSFFRARERCRIVEVCQGSKIDFLMLVIYSIFS